jgi:hypothetical protein
LETKEKLNAKELKRRKLQLFEAARTLSGEKRQKSNG